MYNVIRLHIEVLVMKKFYAFLIIGFSFFFAFLVGCSSSPQQSSPSEAPSETTSETPSETTSEMPSESPSEVSSELPSSEESSEAPEDTQGLKYELNNDNTYTVSKGVSLTTQDIIIPETYNDLPVTKVKENGFLNANIKTIVVPNSVTSIGNGAFSGCSSLESMTLPFVGGIKNAKTASASTLFGYIFGTTNYEGSTETKQEYNYFLVTYYIPTSLKSVTISGGKLLYGSFYNCSNLTSINLGNDVSSIGELSFYNCSAPIIWGDNATVQSFDTFAFSGYKGETLIIPESVTTIHNRAFTDCYTLKSINYYGSLEEWMALSGKAAFRITVSLYLNHSEEEVTSIVIPDTITTIGREAFCNSAHITSISIPSSVTYIDAAAFYGCTSLKSIIIPDSVTYLGVGAFTNCSSLESITLSKNITSISVDTFRNCTGLKTFNIPSNITSIESNAFIGCTGLESIIIPDNVTSIGEGAFNSCSSLTSITLPFIGGSKDASTASSSTLFGYIFGRIKYEGSTKASQKYSYTNGVTYYIPTSLVSVTFTGDNLLFGAFSGCSTLLSITLTDANHELPSSLFSNCTNLASINYYGTLEHWLNLPGKDTFATPVYYVHLYLDGEEETTSITLPTSITLISNFAFFNCMNISSIEFEGTMEEWSLIEKGIGWHNRVAATTVKCSDGIVDL